MADTTLSHHDQESDVQVWLRDSRAELADLLQGQRRGEEPVLQDWLERHPAFVPGARGPGGNSGHGPWPDALISQPRLTGINGKQPDFCWIASDSAQVTAMLVEIETPAKRWQRTSDAVQHADLTQAIEQLNAWRSWFERPHNRAGFLDEYLVPDHIARRHFAQEYILVHGSRSEFEGDLVRERQRAASVRGSDFQLMTFDRLLEIADTWSASFACVRRQNAGYRVVAVPEVFTFTGLTGSALAVTTGYEEAIAANKDIPRERRDELLAQLREQDQGELGPVRFRPR
jgi:hypothetical protein